MTMIKVDPFRSFDTVVRRMGDVFDDIQRGGIRFEAKTQIQAHLAALWNGSLQEWPGQWAYAAIVVLRGHAARRRLAAYPARVD